MDKKIEILLVEDNPGDAGLIEDMLEEFSSFPYELKNAVTLNEGFLRFMQGTHEFPS